MSNDGGAGSMNPEALRARQAARDEEIERAIEKLVRRRRVTVVALICGALVIAALGTWGLYVRLVPPPGPTAEALYESALGYYERGDLPAASRELRLLLQLAPDDADARGWLGKVYVALDDGAAAEKELRLARSLGNRGLEVTIDLLRALLLQRRYTEVLVSTVENDAAGEPEILMFMAEAQLGLKQLEKAAANFERVLELVPAHFQARLGLGRVGLARGELDAAARRVDEAIELDGGNLEAPVLKGRIALATGRFEAAKALFEGVIARDGSRREAHLGLGELLLATGAPQRAMPHFESVAESTGQSVTIRYLEAVALYLSRRPREAREATRRLLRIDPRHVDGRYLMALLHEEAQETLQAEGVLKRLLRISPDHVPARTLLGSIYLELGEPSAAVEVLAPALELAPEEARIRTLLGAAYAKLGQPEKAAEYLDESIDAGSEAAASVSPANPRADLVAAVRRVGRCRLLVRTCETCLYARECL